MCNTPQYSKQNSTNKPLLNPLQLRRLMAVGLYCLLPHIALALPQDSEQPVTISADRTEFDNNRQQHTLSGHVSIKQGSMHISADRIVLQLKDGEIAEINGKGKPLRYSITDSDGQPLEASAQQIVYNPIKATLSLLGGASLNRADRQLNGERIDYNIKSARVSASGNAKKRVTITILPEKKKKP